MDSSLIQWGHCHLRCHRRRLRKRTQPLPNYARHQEEATKNELKSKSLVRTEILQQQDTSPSCSRLLNCRVERNNYLWILISPNRMCAKINLAKFSRNTAHLGLAKFFPSENLPLYGSIYPLERVPNTQ